tara:strand:+ start:4055 stop:4321 length:267 start_codon:yes stop_codon:yes gene_type:complete
MLNELIKDEVRNIFKELNEISEAIALTEHSKQNSTRSSLSFGNDTYTLTDMLGTKETKSNEISMYKIQLKLELLNRVFNNIYKQRLVK